MHVLNEVLATIVSFTPMLYRVGIVAIIVSMFARNSMSVPNQRRLNVLIVVISVPLCLMGVLSAMSGSFDGAITALVWGANGYMSWRQR